MKIHAKARVSNHVLHKGIERFLSGIEVDGKNWQKYYWTILPFLNSYQNVAMSMLLEILTIKRIVFATKCLQESGYNRTEAIIKLNSIIGMFSQAEFAIDAKYYVDEASLQLGTGLSEI